MFIPLVMPMFFLLFSLMGAGSLCLAAGWCPDTEDVFSLPPTRAEQGWGPSGVPGGTNSPPPALHLPL